MCSSDLHARSPRPESSIRAGTTDEHGGAELSLKDPLTTLLPAGQDIHLIHRRMDLWSGADPAFWREAGVSTVHATWGSTEATWSRLKQAYPDPPRVYIVSNNEGGRKPRLEDLASSQHAARRKSEFAQRYPAPQVDSPERLAFAEGYVDKWGAYLAGIRQAMPWPEQRVKLIGYNAFGVNFEVGRWGGWRHAAIPFRGSDMFQWLAWDGAAPDFYAYDWSFPTDEHVGSPHIGSMQGYTMLSDRAIQQVPGYLWQIALWDGAAKRRYRYAWSDGIPASATIGRTAEAIGSSGGTTIRVGGAKPDSLVMRQGEMFSIAGHSQRRPTTCTGIFDGIRIAADPERGAAAALALTGKDIGAVPMPGSLAFSGGTATVTGSGTSLRGVLPDAFFFASQDFTGMRHIQARLVESDRKSVV